MKKKQTFLLTDNISTKGIATSASSKFLQDYIPCFNATIYEKLISHGYTLKEKVKTDEFSILGNYQKLMEKIVADEADFAVGTDSNSKFLQTANQHNLIGYKPSYGLISRYGIIGTDSLTTPAFAFKNIIEMFSIFNQVSRPDNYDMMMFKEELIFEEIIVKKAKIFYIKELITKDLESKIKELKEQGLEIEEITLKDDYLNVIKDVYQIISAVELTSNTANLTGLIYGPKEEGQTIEEIIINNRTKNFTSDLKRKLTFGNYCLYQNNKEQLFIKAKKIRRVLVDKLNELFKTYDALLLPSNDNSLIANLGGYPSVVFNDFNLISKTKNDVFLLNLVLSIIKETEVK